MWFNLIKSESYKFTNLGSNVKLSLIIAILVQTAFLSLVHADEWADKYKLKQYDFIKTFKTSEYICEYKTSVITSFNLNNKKWRTYNNSYQIGKKEFLKIIKSDDFNNDINLCTDKDFPQSSDLHLNKHFCIIEKHPGEKSAGSETHYKCLLDIAEKMNGEQINTLVCNNKDYKFVLNQGKVFDNDFVIGPYSSYDDVLSQQMSTADCMKTR